MQMRFGNTALLFAALAIFLAIGNQAFTNTKAQPVPLNWQTLNLKHGWTAFGNGYRAAAVAIDSNNIVHLRGTVQQPSGTDIWMFTLPSAYRPAGSLAVPVTVNAAGPAYLLISIDGIVQVAANTASLARGFTSLEGVTFPKDGAAVGAP